LNAISRLRFSRKTKRHLRNNSPSCAKTPRVSADATRRVSKSNRAVPARLDRKTRKKREDARRSSFRPPPRRALKTIPTPLARISFASGNLLVLPAVVCLAALDLYNTYILDSRRRRLHGGSRRGLRALDSIRRRRRYSSYIVVKPTYIRTRCRRLIKPSAFTFNWIRRICSLCLSTLHIYIYIYVRTYVSASRPPVLYVHRTNLTGCVGVGRNLFR